MWISKINKEENPFTKLIGFLFLLISIMVSNPYVMLIVLHIYLWKTIEKRDKLTQVSTILDIFLDFFHIFCGKLGILTKILGIFLCTYDFFHNLCDEDARYYYEMIGYRNRRHDWFLNIIYGRKYLKEFWDEQKKREKQNNIKQKRKQLKKAIVKTKYALHQLKVTYCLRLYQTYPTRTRRTKKQITREDIIYLIETSIILLLSICTK